MHAVLKTHVKEVVERRYERMSEHVEETLWGAIFEKAWIVILPFICKSALIASIIGAVLLAAAIVTYCVVRHVKGKRAAERDVRIVKREIRTFDAQWSINIHRDIKELV
ncbi:MAG: hypothetical protein KGL39_28240 [Patescibacteria group bacterium]|nr:hypothetical protein [Patescibacteria group bacterium]